jgi:hypothetical protein
MLFFGNLKFMSDKALGAEAKTQRIESRILTLRGVHVLLDSHLAEMYQVETKTLNRAVQSNIHRFPALFCFQLSAEEWAELKIQIHPSNPSEALRFQSGTLKSPGRGQQFTPSRASTTDFSSSINMASTTLELP